MNKLFISLEEPSDYRSTWTTCAKRLGVEVVGHIDGPNVLPVSNRICESLAKVSNVHYMDSETFDILSDCKDRGLYLPALPAYQSENDILNITGPVFVKPRKNTMKGSSSLSYTRWSSGEELHSLAWDRFSTEEKLLGGLVACPDMGLPMNNLEIDFAVNAKSEVFIMHVFTHGFNEHNRPTNMISGVQAPNELIESVKLFCAEHKITGGIYNIQAVNHNNIWKIMDWNTRPTGMYGLAAAVHPGVADAGLSHMLGLPVTNTSVHIELRSYWQHKLPNQMANDIRSYGLIPTWVWNRDYIGRIYGIGDTKEEVDVKFNAFEKTLNNK